jgi:hypothetical protein
MRIRLGPFSAVLWLLLLWLLAAFWIAHLLGIDRHRFMWVYTALHGAALIAVGNRLERRLTRYDETTGKPLKVKFTSGRIAVMVVIAITWVIEYVILLTHFPRLLTGSAVITPILLLVLPLIIAVTVLETLWSRRMEP